MAIASSAIGAACASACAGRTGGHEVELSQRADRNVLLVTIDTLRSGALGYEGGPARTPNLDRISSHGIRFSFAHAHAVLTLPSHASILTGFYPFQHGYRDNSGYRLAPGTITLAKRLQASGFATGAFVGALPLDARFGLTEGFDTYDGRFDDTPTGAWFVIPERPAGVVVERAVQWIDGRASRWFAWIHVYEPHAPYRPPPPFDRDYAAQPYYGEVAAVDRALGSLFDRVAAGRRPTLVVVTADHGEALGDHGEDTHGLFAYEATLHVPFFMTELTGSGASAAPARAVTATEPARHIDIVPTILDALAMPLPAELPGHSLLNAADRTGGGERASYFEATSGALDYGWPLLTGVLAGRWKYVRLPVPELYDLSTDPGERVNQYSDGDRGRTLERRLAQFNALPPAAPMAERPEVVAGLRALGYTAPSGSRPTGTEPAESDDPKQLVDLDRRMRAAAVLDDQGRLREAARSYGEILEQRPDMTAAARHLAFDQWRLGEARDAIATLERARNRAQSVRGGSGTAAPGLSVQLGAYLTDVGRAPEAIVVLEHAVAIAPGFDALNALGLAYARAGRAPEALAAFERALTVDPGSATAQENLGAVYLDGGRLAEARRAFDRALASSPDSAQALNGIAMVAARTGDRSTAIRNWLRVVALEPQNVDALYDLGITLARDGRNAEARRYLEQFARTAPPEQYANQLRNAGAMLEGLRP